MFRNDTALLLDLHERVHGRGSKDKPQSTLSNQSFIYPLILKCFTVFFEPASYITHNSSSPLATYIWTCRCNLLHTAPITFSLFHSELKTYLFGKSYPPPWSVIVWWTDLMALDRLLDLFAHRFYVSVPFLSVLGIPTCGRLSLPALWSTFVRTI